MKKKLCIYSSVVKVKGDWLGRGLDILICYVTNAFMFTSPNLSG